MAYAIEQSGRKPVDVVDVAYNIRLAPSTIRRQRAGERARWQTLTSAALLAAYFLWFAWDGLHARWANDDVMNIYSAWKPGPWNLITSLVALWRGFNRPLGGVFYSTVYHFFGLDPLPYRIVVLLLLGLNVWLAYRFARALGCDELTSALMATVVSFHANLGSLHYNTDVVYDILCFTFYAAAFVYYTGIRARGRLLRGGEIAVFFGLFLGALDSKEMAVTLPLTLLAYEALYHRPSGWSWKELRTWIAGPGSMVLWAAGMNLVYLYGKKYGPDPLMRMPAYQPVLSWSRFLNFQQGNMADLLFLDHIGPYGLLVLYAATGILAWRFARPVLSFCWMFVWIAPLPVEFLEGRRQSVMYIPLLGWATYAAVVLVAVIRALAQFLATLPGGRRLGARVLAVAMLALVLVPWVRMNRKIQTEYLHPAMLDQGRLTWPIIQQFAAMKPKVPPHSTVAILNDPFQDYDMVFIASLALGDRTVNIHLQRKSQLPESDLAKMPQFTWENGKLLRLR